MKTYNKTIEAKRLEITHDENAESPREWDNLGYMITVDSRYNSPDSNELIESIVRDTGSEAESLEEHVMMIKEAIEEDSNEKVLAIYPVTKYEHGGIVYSLGEKHGFDYSNNGFYIVTDKTAEVLGTKRKDFVKVIEQEIETYNSWVNGEMYCFTLYDSKGDFEDSCCGFYNIEDIREHLPEEWKDEDLSEYINY